MCLLWVETWRQILIKRQPKLLRGAVATGVSYQTCKQHDNLSYHTYSKMSWNWKEIFELSFSDLTLAKLLFTQHSVHLKIEKRRSKQRRRRFSFPFRYQPPFPLFPQIEFPSFRCSLLFIVVTHIPASWQSAIEICDLPLSFIHRW